MTEIQKLEQMLIEANIPFTKDKLWGGTQIRVYYDAEKTKEIDDVVCHPYSHGYEEGLLETYCLNDCEGYETAEQVFKGWQKIYLDKQPKV